MHPLAPIGGEELYGRQGLSGERGDGGGLAAIEGSTSSGNALKRQVLIWDFKCFSL